MPNNPAATKMNPADDSSVQGSDLVDHGDLLRASVRRDDADGGVEASSEGADHRGSPIDYGPMLMQAVRAENEQLPPAKPKVSPRPAVRLRQKTGASSGSGSGNQTPRSNTPTKRKDLAAAEPTHLTSSPTRWDPSMEELPRRKTSKTDAVDDEMPGVERVSLVEFEQSDLKESEARVPVIEQLSERVSEQVLPLSQLFNPEGGTLPLHSAF